MITEALFFTAVATVSMTLAGFSGLLVAFRRGNQRGVSTCFICAGSPRRASQLDDRYYAEVARRRAWW